MKARTIALFAMVGGLTVFAACAEETSGGDDDDGTQTGTTTGTDTGTPTGTTTGTPTGSGVTIEVTQGASTEVVDLGTLTSFACGDGQCVSVDQLILAAFPSVTIGSISADFVAGDGFNPVSSPNCVDLVPVAGSDLPLSRVALLNRNLYWDDSLDFPGCLEVDDLAEVIVSE